MRTATRMCGGKNKLEYFITQGKIERARAQTNNFRAEFINMNWMIIKKEVNWGHRLRMNERHKRIMSKSGEASTIFHGAAAKGKKDISKRKWEKRKRKKKNQSSSPNTSSLIPKTEAHETQNHREKVIKRETWKEETWLFFFSLFLLPQRSPPSPPPPQDSRKGKRKKNVRQEMNENEVFSSLREGSLPAAFHYLGYIKEAEKTGTAEITWIFHCTFSQPLRSPHLACPYLLTCSPFLFRYIPNLTVIYLPLPPNASSSPSLSLHLSLFKIT